MHARFVSTLAAAVCIWALGGTPASAQFYEQHTFVSDGSVPADHVDPLLVNAWGLVAGPTSPWWVADNGTTARRSTTARPAPRSRSSFGAGRADRPGVQRQLGRFMVNDGAARFIFATEDGTILGWNGGTAADASRARGRRDLQGPRDRSDAASTALRDQLPRRHGGRVRRPFAPVPGGFSDPTSRPATPRSASNLNGTIFVTYAIQDEDAEDDVAGAGPAS